VKILAGDYKGHPFAQPKTTSVRPLSDKVRAAIFDVTGPVTSLSVLDAYAGSGAAGFEAVSRGAVHVDAIEANERVAKVIVENVTTLGLDWGYVLNRMTVETWLASPQQLPRTERYGVIIADPPYAKLDPEILERLVPYLTPDGVMVVSHTSKMESPDLDNAKLVQHKTYGDTALSFYRKSHHH
jgi:16S rRNA (guanine966-N2)-methyltransferase